MIILKWKRYKNDDPNGSGNSIIQILTPQIQDNQNHQEHNIKEKHQRWWP
ncbi:hypothetical protein HYE34_02525 [Mycoplasmopsis bovis]|nr:hypothetical protein HYE34_02525 [Mycoplasmopsis bovis]